MRIFRWLAVAALLLASAPSASATTWFFSPSGNDSTGTGTSGAPWAWAGAHTVYQPGDILRFAAGSYTETDASNMTLKASGTALLPIHLACATNLGCTITNTSASQSGIFLTGGASYWDIGGQGGFVITQSGANATANGIFISGNGGAPYGAIHHITVQNNVISGMSGACISVGGNNNNGLAVDYITIKNNIAFNCARQSGFHTSGISIYQPIIYDILPGYHYQIVGNISYFNNDCDSCGNPTDGNGLIMDDFMWAQSPGTPYVGASLIADNLIFNNGGRGIHLFSSPKSARLDVIHNTVCGNNTDSHVTGSTTYEIGVNTGYGGAAGQVNGGNVGIYNNIVIATALNNVSLPFTSSGSTASGSYQLVLNSVAGITGGMTVSGLNVVPGTLTYGVSSGTTIQLNQGTAGVLPTGTAITISNPIYALGENGNGGGEPNEPTNDLMDWNYVSAVNGQNGIIYGTDDNNSFTFGSHNKYGTAPGLTCPTFTTLQPFATLVAAATPAAGSAPLLSGTPLRTYPTDINGKARVAWHNDGKNTDMGAVQVSP